MYNVKKDLVLGSTGVFQVPFLLLRDGECSVNDVIVCDLANNLLSDGTLDLEHFRKKIISRYGFGHESDFDQVLVGYEANLWSWDHGVELLSRDYSMSVVNIFLGELASNKNLMALWDVFDVFREADHLLDGDSINVFTNRDYVEDTFKEIEQEELFALQESLGTDLKIKEGFDVYCKGSKIILLEEDTQEVFLFSNEDEFKEFCLRRESLIKISR
ncbi:hypothetical protein ACV1QZ_21380 [Bacillus subtilis]|uniref:hypothetical protein n=1 Tax=Bacillus licheniformis TaxID=1402 RepID=UPI000E4972D8|nr:hypothetical protein [Bacillus licheniformis]RHL12288.1 hypothetical protein DW032_18770 [Bacillus licheniformis]